MSATISEPLPDLELDDIRELMRSVALTTERLEATHTALQNQVARLQRELAEANAQLQRSRALAALGEMAAGIAHEVRNPLASIQLYVQVLGEELRDRPEQAKLCEKVSRAVIGLDAIVRDVLTFARNMEISPGQATADELFDRALAGCDALLSEGDITLARDVHEDCKLVADANLMVQAIGNLIRNGVEAIRASEGESSASRELRLYASRRSMRCPDGKQRERMVLAIEDTGPGIPPEVIERMFNPFFTTRKTGTGLGLAIVHRIVDAHNGHVNVTNAKPHGARIEICLPPNPNETNQPRAESADMQHTVATYSDGASRP